MSTAIVLYNASLIAKLLIYVPFAIHATHIAYSAYSMIRSFGNIFTSKTK